MGKIIKDTFKTAGPAILGALFSFSQETINLMFIGHLNDKVLIAAVGMGNIAINMLGVSIYFGFNGALDTLVSQALGTNDMRLCGIYL